MSRYRYSEGGRQYAARDITFAYFATTLFGQFHYCFTAFCRHHGAAAISRDKFRRGFDTRENFLTSGWLSSSMRSLLSAPYPAIPRRHCECQYRATAASRTASAAIFEAASDISIDAFRDA